VQEENILVVLTTAVGYIFCNDRIWFCGLVWWQFYGDS